jgi:hypothetical protein
MHHAVEDVVNAEIKIGIDSHCLDMNEKETHEIAMDADINVVNSWVPNEVREKGGKIVWVAHGTPEHCFQQAVEHGLHKGYIATDPWMQVLYWIQNSDALVTHWPRHQALWSQFCDKRSWVDLVPMGVNKEFWATGSSSGKWLGVPSIFTAENAHNIKWPLDLVYAWPWVMKAVPNSRLHMHYLPHDQHRWWFPFLYGNGTLYGTFASGLRFTGTDLRNCFNSADYYIGLVKYGDFNRICLEAKASGCKTISFVGNEYSDYWLPEGDQRIIAKELIKILKDEVEPRESLPVPDISETAEAMKKIYERIL